MNSISNFVIENGVLVKYSGCDPDVIIPDGVTEIGENAFNGNTTLKNVVLPAGVTSIGSSAFGKCSKLVSVEMPDSLKTIERYAFWNSRKLEKVELPSGLQKIGQNAFRWTGLKEITVPKSVTEIGKECFCGCDGLMITVFDTLKAPLGQVAYWIDIYSRKWTCCEHRIRVKNAETDLVKYIIYMGKETGTTGPYREAVIEGWKNGADFDFSVLPQAFASLKDAGEKREVAELRLRYPWNLGEEEKAIYTSYLKRGVKKYVTECAKSNDYDRIAFYNEQGLLQKASLDSAIEESLNNGNNEMAAYLVDLKKTLPGKEKVAGTGLSLAGKIKKDWEAHKENPNLVKRYQGDEHEIVFPEEINGQKITGIADATAKLPDNYLAITSVVIPEGYTVIGKNAFNGCTALQNIKLPSTLTRIEKNAFLGCKELKSIQMPESLKYIGDYAFDGTGIQEFEFFSNTNIGDYALGKAEVLISRGSFSGTMTNNHYIGNCLIYVYSDGKVDGTGLPGKTMMPLSYIGIKTNDLVKEENSLLKDKTVCTLGDLPGLPKGISYFPRILFGDFIKKCGGNPGDRFGKDTDILIVKDVDTENTTVQRAIKQGTIVVSELEFLQSIRDGRKLEKKDYSEELAKTEQKKQLIKNKGIDPKYKKSAIKKNWDFDLKEDGSYILTRYKSKDTVVTIPAFIDDIPVKEVADICHTFKSGIRESRRKELNEITEVFIEEGITTIGTYAFYGCKGLKKVVLPDTVTEIGKGAFEKCIELQDINLTDAIKKIDDGAFHRCSQLKDGNGFIIRNNILFGYEGNEEAVVIPPGITKISADAFILEPFSFRKGINRIVIPDTVKSIGSHAFDGLVDLKEISIPDSVEEYGRALFSRCNSLADDNGFIIMKNRLYSYVGNDAKAIIPDDVISIEKGAFSYAFDLKELTIPESVKRIESLPLNDKLKIHAVKGSYAYEYAIENKYKIV